MLGYLMLAMGFLTAFAGWKINRTQSNIYEDSDQLTPRDARQMALALMLLSLGLVLAGALTLWTSLGQTWILIALVISLAGAYFVAKPVTDKYKPRRK
ncbi:hypothetical protein AWM75_01050 [Aerococcus urinaehominis]|uniref:Uncharacterized protein n=1 Tax=Aerococcus urinaehominis TaxID=128944 RepID=A0A120IAP1_9LACT|nr:hypothetical protein [Aerococcus urinaehominis]AMB98665.1 hypothetical protein AWM75_01050 [Aerococcus urinaehominis]SDL97788.1 hypothetical protein SAMN04487985_10371 [Aerococcus urinaehominis]